MKHILSFLAATAFMYLLFAFTTTEFNPIKWGTDVRFFLSFITFIFAYATAAIYRLNKLK